MNETPPIAAQLDEDRQAFLRYLPKRILAFEQRIRRYANEGWDPVGILILRGDVQRLAETSGRYGLNQSRQLLRKLSQRIGDHIEKNSVPDRLQTSRMFELLSTVITDSKALLAGSEPGVGSSEQPHATHMAGGAAAAAQGGTVPLEQAESVQSAESARTTENSVRRIYHLTTGNAFAIELAQRLEAEGYAIEQLSNLDELSDLMMCLLPQWILVDALHMSDLTGVARLRRDSLERLGSQRPMQIIYMAVDDSMETQRSVQRAGVDLVLTPPFDMETIVARLQALDSSVPEEKVRVLIVEDNRADAFYAQSVLINAGMQAHVEMDPLKVLESLRLLHPDLVLMDLHMPFANGVEVTFLIRENPVFARLPIVFLSAESDPDSRIEAINAGGDDYLIKPIRPRNLIAAVRDRMRRMHPIGRQGSGN